MYGGNRQDKEGSARELHDESIVIDACIPTARPCDVKTMLDAGLTAAMVTITDDILDDCRQTLERVARWYDGCRESSHQLILATTTADIEEARKAQKVAVILALQDTRAIESNVSLLDVMHRLGIRVMQLTYQNRNYIGDGSAEHTDCGLSEFGKAVIKRMNHLGILIDLSHCGYCTTMEAIAESEQPVAFTHILPRSLSAHPVARNKSDEQISALAERGGVVGLHTWSKLGERQQGVRPALSDYLDYIEYVVNLVGVEHVGIGSDFCPGWNRDPNMEDQFEVLARRFPELYEGYTVGTKNFEGLQDVQDVRNITRGLLERGFTENDVRRVIGLNWLELLDRVWC